MQPSFSTFLNLVFLTFVWTQSNFSSAWYDNQISLFVVFFFCFFLSCYHDLSAPGNDAYHKWLSRLKHHFSCRNCFEMVVFWSQIVHTISVSKNELWLKRYSIRWVIVFLINMPQGINQGWFWNIMVLGLVFLVIEKDLIGLKL